MKLEPYVGPRPFTLEDGGRFFGRRDELDEIVSLVMSHPVVLLYARSGVGKSSLVHAGLVPALRREDYTVLPPARVDGAVPEEIAAAEIANPLIFHALSCWLDKEEVPFCGAAEVTGLRLADFVAAWLEARPAERADETPVLIFEEIITAYEGRWKDRNDFFLQLGEALREHADLKIVLTVREEFVALLEPFVKHLPNNLRTRKRLEPLTRAAALEAIQRPVATLGIRYAEGVAEKLVSDLAGLAGGPAEEGGAETGGDLVQPVQLQVVCRNLWERLPAEFKVPAAEGAPERMITQAHVDAVGEVTAALSTYYNEAVAAAVAASGAAEGTLRRWFDTTLIGPDRASLGMAVRGQATMAGIPEQAVRVLIDEYLLRHEKRGVTEWYELAQARFIRPIRESNNAWFRERSGPEAIRVELERRAEALRSTGACLEEWEIGQAENFLASPQAAELGNHAEIVRLVERSRAQVREDQETRERELKQQAIAAEQAQRLAEKERAIRVRNRLLAGLAVMVVAALTGAIFSRVQTRWARKESAVARDQRQWALAESKTAKARELAFRAVDATARDPELAVLLALESYSVQPTTEGVSALHRSLVASPIRLRLTEESMRESSVTTCAYSPDSSTIATSGNDLVIRLWDAVSGKLRGRLAVDQPAGGGLVWSVAFSPDGRRLAAARNDGIVAVWPYPPVEGRWAVPALLTNVPERGTVRRLRTVAFDATGERLVASMADGTARIWRVADGVEVLRLRGHAKEMRSAVFSLRENLAVTAGSDGLIAVWDLAAPAAETVQGVPILKTPRHALRSPEQNDGAFWDAQFSPDGTRIVSGGADHVARVWDVATGTQLAVLDPTLGAPIVQAKFVGNDDVVTVSADKTARRWRLSPAPPPGGIVRPPAPGPQPLIGTTLAVMRGHTGTLHSVAVSRDSRKIVTTSRDGTALVWRPFPTSEVAAQAMGAIIRSAAYSASDGRLAVAFGNNLEVWEADAFGEKQPLFALPPQPTEFRQVCFSPDGKWLATTGVGGVACVWDSAKVAEPRRLSGELRTVAFHPSGRYLVGASSGSTVAVVDRETGATISLTGNAEEDGRFLAATFSPDGKYVAAGSVEGWVRVWDWAAQKQVASDKFSYADVALDVNFDATGQRIAVAWGDGRASVWDWTAAERKPQVQIRANEGQVRRAMLFDYPAPQDRDATNPNPRRHGLLTAGFDGAVRVWGENAETQEWTLAYELPGPTMSVYAVAISADGSLIFTGGADRVGRVYYTDAESLLGLANSRVTRDLTPAERTNFGLAPKGAPSADR